jgi:hypothetical protein
MSFCSILRVRICVFVDGRGGWIEDLCTYDETTWCRGYMNEKRFHDTMTLQLWLQPVALSSQMSKFNFKIYFSASLTSYTIHCHKTLAILKSPKAMFWFVHFILSKINNPRICCLHLISVLLLYRYRLLNLGVSLVIDSIDHRKCSSPNKSR